MLIAFEGPSGVGKTTQCSNVRNKLERKGFSVAVLNDALAKDPIALQVRAITHPVEIVLGVTEELFLYGVRLARKAALYRSAIQGSLRFDIVLADRWALSLLALFVHVRGCQRNVVETVIQAAGMRLSPATTFLLGADLTEIQRRRKGKRETRKTKDFYAYYGSYWQGFLTEARHDQLVEYLDTTKKTADTVASEITNRVENLMKNSERRNHEL